MSVKRELIKGTLILTAAGFMARLLGLLNRIYLANLISNAELGRYQLIFPVFMFCMAVSSTGMQVAVSKMISAYHAAGQRREMQQTVSMAIAWSLSLSLLCSAVLYTYSEPISIRILNESACGPYLRILAAALPFAAMHNCVSGYFYGCREAAVPAAAQLLEQLARVGCIYGLSVMVYHHHPADAAVAVWGLAAGELVSCLLTIICYKIHIHREGKMTAAMESTGKIRRRLWRYAGWLTVNRVSVTLLQSAEMILIPLMLAVYCGNSNQALELFGVITGIVMPVISFPNTLTNALSTLLLPAVSEAEAVHNYGVIADTFEKSIQYCLMMGIFASMLFAVYGSDVGRLLFNDTQAGYYIRIFAVLCPLMYIQSLLSGTLNGLGKMNETLMHHVIASAIKIGSILLLVPKTGIQGYVIGIFTANAVVTAIAAVRMYQLAGVHLHAVRFLLLPACAAVLSAQISIWSGHLRLTAYFPGNGESIFWRLLWQCGVMTLVFLAFMLPWMGITVKKRLKK